MLDIWGLAQHIQHQDRLDMAKRVAGLNNRPVLEQVMEDSNPGAKIIEKLLNAVKRNWDSRAYAGQYIPPDKYDPRGPEVSEEHFKDTITKESQGKYVWVMFTTSDPGMPASIKEKGDAFWNILKESFGNQVDGYINIDTYVWNSYAASFNEIKKKSFPAYLLYKNGEVVNDGTEYDIRLYGPPKSTPDNYLRYIKEHTRLR